MFELAQMQKITALNWKHLLNIYTPKQNKNKTHNWIQLKVAN